MAAATQTPAKLKVDYDLMLPGLINPLTPEECERLSEAQRQQQNAPLIFADDNTNKRSGEPGGRRNSRRTRSQLKLDECDQKKTAVEYLQDGFCPLCELQYESNIEDHIMSKHVTESLYLVDDILAFFENEGDEEKSRQALRGFYENRRTGVSQRLRWGHATCAFCDHYIEMDITESSAVVSTHFEQVHAIENCNFRRIFVDAACYGFSSGVLHEKMYPPKPLNVPLAFGCNLCAHAPVLFTIGSAMHHLKKEHNINDMETMWHMLDVQQGRMDTLPYVAAKAEMQMQTQKVNQTGHNRHSNSSRHNSGARAGDQDEEAQVLTAICPFCPGKQAMAESDGGGDGPTRYKNMAALGDHMKTEHNVKQEDSRLVDLLVENQPDDDALPPNWVDRNLIHVKNSRAIGEVSQAALRSAAMAACPDEKDPFCGCYPVTLQVMKPHRDMLATMLRDRREPLPASLSEQCPFCQTPICAADLLNHMTLGHQVESAYHIMLRVGLQEPIQDSDCLPIFSNGLHCRDWRLIFKPDLEEKYPDVEPGETAYCPFCLTYTQFLSAQAMVGHIQVFHLVSGEVAMDVARSCFDKTNKLPLQYDKSNGYLRP